MLSFDQYKNHLLGQILHIAPFKRNLSNFLHVSAATSPALSAQIVGIVKEAKKLCGVVVERFRRRLELEFERAALSQQSSSQIIFILVDYDVTPRPRLRLLKGLWAKALAKSVSPLNTSEAKFCCFH